MCTDSSATGTVVVTHNTAHYIALHYMEFIESLVALGYRVQIVAPRDKAFLVLEGIGAQCHDFPLSRRGMNPLSELYSVFFLWRFLRRLNPVVVFNYSIKPVIYGSFVARLCGVPHIYSMVTGLGYIFAKDSVLKRLVLSFYKHVLKYNEKVFFQNSHDRDEFLRHRLLEPRNAIVVKGTGIDLEKFHPVEGGQETPVFLLMSRMLWEKGVEEFVVAAGALSKAYPQARFQLLGPIDDNPSAIPREQLDRWQLEGVEYLGETADVRPFLGRATVFVLPSYYREGRPRATLEAMAMGKPVITTDWPGCRDPIKHGVNGYLIPVRNSNELRLAMERFLVDEDLAQKMGKQSRRIVEREYDVHQVNRQILAYFPNSGQSGCCAA